MPTDRVQALVDWLRSRSDCVVEDGLDEAELARAQDETSVRFSPLWRAALALAHPVAAGPIAYPDWRLRDASAARLVAAPLTGVLFDVEHNRFWWPAWGERPQDLASALDIARDQLMTVPHLVPIRGHWYTGSGNDDPLLSIVQTDLFLVARSLTGLAVGHQREDLAVHVIPFWTDLLGWSNGGRRAVQE